MTWAVVVKRGRQVNLTLSSILFDKWGTKIHQDIILCDDWSQGQHLALNQGHDHALFVNSGTVFTDWVAWRDLLDRYPHQGLIGHIIWHPGSTPRLHEQCWYMNIEILRFDPELKLSYPMPIRSDKDLHDNYTPLWLRPGSGTDLITHERTAFGQDLICQQLKLSRSVINWNHQARNIKHFSYDETSSVLDLFRDYLDLAEQQLWVLNNEPVITLRANRLIMPGSGLCWILNVIEPQVYSASIVDISRTQIQFCDQTWQHWNGEDWGDWTWNFIKHNKVRHFQLDRTDFSDLEMLRFRNGKNFVTYVNDKFDRLLQEQGYSKHTFAQAWHAAKSSKQIDFTNQNIVEWTLRHKSDLDDCALWTSNVLDYKWTLLNTGPEQIEQFKELVDEI